MGLTVVPPTGTRHALSAPARDAGSADIAAPSGADAQVLSAAKWSIGAADRQCHPRASPGSPVAEHSLVKTFRPRGTVHLLPMQDLPLWTGALSALPLPLGAVCSAAWASRCTSR
jgi:hypothetical protein